MYARVRIPKATYRLQFNSQFHFADAQALVSYLDRLGVSDIYASPIFKSRKGSDHGYDIIDPTQLNPELGTGTEFNSMVQEIKNHDMGLILDIVPNHMGVSSENPFLVDILENGISSRYTSFFDIDWVPCSGTIQNQVLLPILGKPYGRALEDQEISLELQDTTLFIRYYDTRLPVSLKSYFTVLSFRLDALETKRAVERSEFQQLKQLLTDIKKLPDTSDVPGLKNNNRTGNAFEKDWMSYFIFPLK